MDISGDVELQDRGRRRRRAWLALPVGVLGLITFLAVSQEDRGSVGVTTAGPGLATEVPAPTLPSTEDLAVVPELPQVDVDVNVQVKVAPLPLPAVRKPPVTLPVPPSPSTRTLPTVPSLPTTTVAPPQPATLLGRIVYTSDHTDAGTTGDYDLWVMDAGGGNRRRLTTRVGPDMEADVSADGRRVVWVHGYEGPALGWRIYRMAADGSGVVALTDESGDYHGPRFSPDGSRIVFTSGASAGNLRVMGADGSGVSSVPGTTALAVRHASWSPDGTRLVVDTVERDALWIVDPEGGTATRLETGAQYSSWPAWSPKGDAIAFAADGQIATIRPDGSGFRQLSTGGDGRWDPAWSADGTRMIHTLFHRDADGSMAYADYDVVMIGADGTGEANLTDSRIIGEHQATF